MLPLIQFTLTAAVLIFVALVLVKKKEAARKASGKAGNENMPGGSLFFAGDRSRAESVSDISVWEKTANELSGALIRPDDNPSGNLAIAGRVNDLPYRIELILRDRKVFYSLALPFEPKLKNQAFVVRCVSEQAHIAKNRIMILCPGTAPEPSVVKELAAHAGRLLMTIPFEEEADEDRPESAFRRKHNAETVDVKTTEPVPEAPEPVVTPEPDPVMQKPEPVMQKPEPVIQKPEPAPVEERQTSPAPADSKEEVKEEEASDNETTSPESLAEVIFRSTLPGPAEKEYFASLTGRRVEWTGTVRMAYEISSDFVFGRVKGVKVQMDLCTVAGKYGRQTLRGTAVFPPESYAVFRASSNKTIRFRGTILKLEAFSREVYLSEGELL